MQDYKQEIIQTRTGCLGSSDAAMLAQIANLGQIPKTAIRRLAVAKGLAENKGIPYTAAVAAGDKIEQAIYEHLSAKDDRYQSNPLWVSQRYSKPNLKLISHPDIVLQDEEHKVLYVYEVKTTKESVEQTKYRYKAQLFVHFTIGREIATQLGHDWRFHVYLVHYDTNGLDLENGIEFDPQRMTITECRFTSQVFDIEKGMTIANAFVETLDFYADDDEVDAELLPAQVKEQFLAVTNMLREIKEREAAIDDFKRRLYDFLDDKGIKSIRGGDFTISRVEPTVSKSFDYKRYLQDLESKHPRKCAKIRREYEKVSNKRGYVTIKLNTN